MLTLKACLAHYAQWLLNKIPKPVYRIRGSYDAPLRGFFKALFYVERKEVLESAHSARKHWVEVKVRLVLVVSSSIHYFLCVSTDGIVQLTELHWIIPGMVLNDFLSRYISDRELQQNHNANCH